MNEKRWIQDHTEKVPVSTNITQNFMDGRAVFFFLQIFYKRPATDSDVSDVNKRPCSIDKSDISTSLTRRRCPRRSTLFFSNTVTDTAAIFSRLKGRHRQDVRKALLILNLEVKTQFRIDTATKHARGWSCGRHCTCIVLCLVPWLSNDMGEEKRGWWLLRCTYG